MYYNCKDSRKCGERVHHLLADEHFYGIVVYIKLVDVPEETKSVPIGQNRKRGRPALSKKSLDRSVIST